MKNLIFLMLLIISFYSCTKQNKILELPVEKLYIVEYNWRYLIEDNEIAFGVFGFSELDKNYNLRYAFNTQNYGNYYTSNIVVADSLKNKISDIIMKYSVDTTFLYKGGERIYDGNSYIFIMQKNDSVKTRIDFEPKFLPDDLAFLYNCLYEDRQRYEWINKYEDLFNEFGNTIMSGREVAPPPMLKKTIQFIPPKVVKKTHK